MCINTYISLNTCAMLLLFFAYCSYKKTNHMSLHLSNLLLIWKDFFFLFKLLSVSNVNQLKHCHFQSLLGKEVTSAIRKCNI